MKKLIFILTAMILFVSTSVFAQSDKFNYQAAIRDASGEIMQNESVNIAFSIKSGTASGTEVYAETHSVSTNDQGLVNLTIGSGTTTSGTFSTIDWSANSHFLNVEIDGTDMGTSEFQSVPYAIYAQTAGNVFSGDYNDLTNTPTIGSSLWTQSVDSTYIEDGRVGIGTTNPKAKFSVVENTSNTGVMTIENEDTLGFAGTYFYSGGENKGYIGHVGSGFWCESNSLQLGSIGGADIVLMASSCNADLTVKANTGDIEIKGELNRPSSTGAANMIPIAYGVVQPSGTIATGASTSNFTVTNIATGVYEVVMAGTSLIWSNTIVNATINSTSLRHITYESINTGGVNKMRFYTFDHSGSPINSYFNFVFYQL